MFYWALTDGRWCYSLNTLTIWARTDVPCFLVLRYSPFDPIYPVTWPERRGVPHKAIEPTFPPEWRAIAQNEPGLVLEHTFTWNSWQEFATRWFILTLPHRLDEDASHAGPFHFSAPADPILTPIFYEPWTS